jgi:hypothetical protein
LGDALVYKKDDDASVAWALWYLASLTSHPAGLR